MATAIFAAVRRRPIEAVSLIAGWLIVFVLVQITKTAYDRARPPEGLVDTFNAAYPSGHSAYAISLIACATVLVRAGVGWAVRIAAVTVAVILAAVVGVTRIYLRAHFLTDVLGGFALAAGDLVARRRIRAFRGTRSPQCARMTDDEKTYLIAGAAAAISLIAWLWLVVVPAWKSYWRVRDRLVATVLSVYVLAAFVLAGAGVGAAVLWYFSDRL